MFHRIDTVLIPFSNCGRRGWEISKYYLAFNQNSNESEKTEKSFIEKISANHYTIRHCL